MTTHTTFDDTTNSLTNIAVCGFDVRDLREVYPAFDSLARPVKHRLTVRAAREGLVPIKWRDSARNTTTDVYHEMLVNALCGSLSEFSEVTDLAAGDGTAVPSASDTSVSGELGRVQVTTALPDDPPTSYTVTAFIDSSEMNDGGDLSHFGFYANGTLVNHVEVTPRTKDNLTYVTVEGVVGFDPA